MTKALQKRFIIAAMAVLTVLLVFLLGIINIAYGVIVQQKTADLINELVSSHNAASPGRQGPCPPPPDAPFPEKIDDLMGARYFLICFDPTGRILQTNVNFISAVTAEEAEQLALEVYHSGSTSGNYHQFLYRTTQLKNGCFILFLDVSAQRSSLIAILLVSIMGGFLCWCAMLALVVLLSRRVISPIAETMEKQKQFVTNAGHEIKTPLAIILSNTDAMELHIGENKWSRNIRAQVERLTGLMQNLLTLAKMDEGADLPMTDFSIRLLLGELLDQYSEPAKTRNLRFQTSLHQDVVLHANRESILQLLSILLDNAVKYAPANGTVFLSLEKPDRRAVIRIENTCEAPPKDLERLFDRFYRGDAARTQSCGGCGIGLSAARAIAEQHGGTITASYDPACKTITFTVIL